MISTVELEKRVAGASILNIVVGKLCHGRKLCPIILLEVDKSLEVDFHHIIMPFGLPVYLGVENGGEFLLDT